MEPEFREPDYDWTDPARVERLWEGIRNGALDVDALQGNILAAHNQGARAGYAVALELPAGDDV